MRAFKTWGMYVAGIVLAVFAIYISAHDTDKHQKQERIQHRIEYIRDLETRPPSFPTLETTSLSPYPGDIR